jgi:acetoin utilization deacetylase AcuC-like enzyme
MQKRTGFVYHSDYLKHDTGEGHPERSGRLVAIVERLRRLQILDKLCTIEPKPADIKWIEEIHSSSYIHRVRESCIQRIPYLDSIDTPICEFSYDAALLAAGGVVVAVDSVMSGEVSNVFCAVRPPGHHALTDMAMGFCIFNNVAIGARYIQRKYNLGKILIVDWDVHHGNGTQSAFYDDPAVLYFSVHQYPHYPGTGATSETGKGAGKGFTLNVPLVAGLGDSQYVRAFNQDLKPAALKFSPDFVLISAGFDAHASDPLSDMQLSTEGFARLTVIVKEIASYSAGGRIVSVLEGGYNLSNLTESVAAHILELARLKTI